MQVGFAMIFFGVNSVLEDVITESGEIIDLHRSPILWQCHQLRILAMNSIHTPDVVNEVAHLMKVSKISSLEVTHRINFSLISTTWDIETVRPTDKPLDFPASLHPPRHLLCRMRPSPPPPPPPPPPLLVVFVSIVIDWLSCPRTLGAGRNMQVRAECPCGGGHTPHHPLPPRG